MPEKSGAIITQYMQQFAESAGRLTAVGIVILTITAMLLLLTIDKAFNVIWRVARPRPLAKRLVAYWAVLTLSPLLVGASLSLTSWLVGLSMGHAKYVSPFGVMILKVLPVLFATLAFALLFRVVPNRHVPTSHALIGAFISAMAFEAMSRVFGYYISHFPTYTLVYGAFASVPIFLMWIYLSWLTILLGAVITASLSHWRAPAVQQITPVMRLLDALRVLQIMENGFHQGRVSTLPELSRTLRLGYDTLENILEDLSGADIVRKVVGNGWLLMRDTKHIRTTELLHLFLIDRDSLSANTDGNDGWLRDWLAKCAEHMEQCSDTTLQELFLRRDA